MAKVRVALHIERDIDEVFNRITDHETFLSQGKEMRTHVVTPGKVERNGLGCIREIRVGKRIRYLEEITGWVRPTSFEYIIREASIPIRHHGSRLEFSRKATGTEITWTSHYDVPVPVIGWAIAAYMKRKYEAVFGELLARANY